MALLSRLRAQRGVAARSEARRQPAPPLGQGGRGGDSGSTDCEPRQRRTRKQRGVAMLIVLTWLALMISVIGEFTYGTSVDAAQAANARDELRAHYLARSSVSLSRLLIKIQQQFVDPVMGQVQ